jgi:hypothetical protein
MTPIHPQLIKRLKVRAALLRKVETTKQRADNQHWRKRLAEAEVDLNQWIQDSRNPGR